jgi:hypothetical protein
VQVWKAGGKYTYKAASSDRQAANPRQFGWRDAFDIAVRCFCPSFKEYANFHFDRCCFFA